jgi:hypothetical protein
MPLDATKHADWEIAEAAEKNMKTTFGSSEGRTHSQRSLYFKG